MAAVDLRHPHRALTVGLCSGTGELTMKPLMAALLLAVVLDRVLTALEKRGFRFVLPAQRPSPGCEWSAQT